MTSSLPELQEWMHRALLNPHAAQPQEMAKLLIPNPRLKTADALATYQRSYSLRIAACMREQFPALCYALGEGLFNDFVADYVREAPPESYTLYDLGRRFSVFLEANRPDREMEEKESWIDFIVDLARFERAVFTTFDGPGAEEMQLATVQTPDDRLGLNPSLSIGRYRFPVARYYHEVRQHKSPAPPREQPCCVAVVRKDFLTTTVLISPRQYLFLEAMTQRSSVDNAWARVASTLTVPETSNALLWEQLGKVRTPWMGAGFFIVNMNC